jgi:hypothetical protein
MVGDGQGRHIHLPGAFDQLLDVRETIQQGVFGVDVQVGKGHSSLGQVTASWLKEIIARMFGLKIVGQGKRAKGKGEKDSQHESHQGTRRYTKKLFSFP